MPIIRPAGRVIVADAADRILLIRVEFLPIGEPVLWITPGGACEGDETADKAALRELLEETGIRALEIGPCVWHRRHVWEWGDRTIDSREHYYFLRVDGQPAIKPLETSDLELGTVKEYRWWTVTELEAASADEFAPRRLPALVPTLLRGSFPAEPIDVGI